VVGYEMQQQLCTRVCRVHLLHMHGWRPSDAHSAAWSSMHPTGPLCCCALAAGPAGQWTDFPVRAPSTSKRLSPSNFFTHQSPTPLPGPPLSFL
jgi:hypothetical protein